MVSGRLGGGLASAVRSFSADGGGRADSAGSAMESARLKSAALPDDVARVLARPVFRVATARKVAVRRRLREKR